MTNQAAKMKEAAAKVAEEIEHAALKREKDEYVVEHARIATIAGRIAKQIRNLPVPTEPMVARDVAIEAIADAIRREPLHNQRGTAEQYLDAALARAEQEAKERSNG